MILLHAVLLSMSALGPISTFHSAVGKNEPADRPAKVVIGYVQDEDPAPGVLDLVDFAKITHLNVAFANPTDDSGTLAATPHLDQLIALAHKNSVRVFLSIGGGAVSEDKTSRERYFALISNPNRSAFVAKLAKFLEDHQLDGLDVDLEGPAIDKDYGSFIADLSKVLKPEGKGISAAVSAWYGGDQIPPAALNSFDFVNVMAYDQTGPWNPNQAGQHSSLDYAKQCTAYWLNRGVPKHKLVLGVPFYGYGFGAAYTKDGYKYSQIVDQFPGADQVDQAGKTIWYNGIPTIQAKTQYAIDQDLGGVMIWSLNQDAKGKLSLLTAIHETLTGAPK